MEDILEDVVLNIIFNFEMEFNIIVRYIFNKYICVIFC